MRARIQSVEARVCPCCGRMGEPLDAHLEDRSFGAPGVWAHRECRACELLWIDPRPTAQALPALYERYFTHESPPPESLARRALHRGLPAALGHGPAPRSVAERGLGRIFALLGPLRELGRQSVGWLGAPPGRVLDVGCGSGALLENLAHFGWQGAGVENDPEAAAVASARLGLEVHAGPIESAPFAEHSFDALTLFHVIEHLDEPRRALERALELLTPHGRLVVATPNMNSLGRAHFASSWLHLDPPRHLQIYSLASLVRLVEAAGFRVREAFTPATSAHPVFCGSWLVRERGALPGLDFSATPARVALSALAFWAYEYLRCHRGEACGEDAVVIAEPVRA